ncbi:hypothetical protein GCM10010124_29900 [Pilimelia terevasa]|uniref:Thioredoxin domain-containing protein n=1 Tax=Pilimelia terevasa TaxID=53372 RepID=A0A8J3FJX1_9ACTN|nr:NHL domain-containing thioredoxin family protein [Pilimelia terevasa]GGK35220.1 hypothetical protein GCM10010124_29900 [Pilimelia terevasa]
MGAPSVRAPELRGRAWLNTGGRDLSLAALRGRIVVLDFWTFCCVNCLHVLDELRPLEERYADVLVVVGVHSPKFAHERDPAAVAAAVERYGVTHPVLDDPDLITWGRYAAKAWPTLAVVDPAGRLVATMAGEGHAEGLARLVDELVAVHGAQGTLRRGDGPYVPPPPAATTLRFPGKAVATPDGGFLVSDTARHRIVGLAADGETVTRVIGDGTAGHADGPADAARFREPQGLCALPADRAAALGYDLVVADTVNHRLRAVRLADGAVWTLAGTGRQWRAGTAAPPDAGAEASTLDLSSPWDVAWYQDRIIVAMAGIHQLWWYDPDSGRAGVYAGTTVEALRDGPLPDVWLAQPSGLAPSPDGTRLWLVDSETSALRYVADGALHTVVGQGLFDFGHADGPAGQALLQHPLGLCPMPDGTVLVADTYNGAVRRYDPATDTVDTVDTGLAEPSDVLVAADGAVVVVESAAHRLTRLAATPAPGAAHDTRHRTERPATPVAAGTVTLRVVFTPAPGQKLDDAYGPPTRLEITASPAALLLDGAGVGTDLHRQLTLNPDVPGGVLQVVAQAATCDADAAHAACHLVRQDWGVPVRVDGDGEREVALILRGIDDPGGG